jgi:hypothetical protein
VACTITYHHTPLPAPQAAVVVFAASTRTRACPNATEAGAVTRRARLRQRRHAAAQGPAPPAVSATRRCSSSHHGSVLCLLAARQRSPVDAPILVLVCVRTHCVCCCCLLQSVLQPGSAPPQHSGGAVHRHLRGGHRTRHQPGACSLPRAATHRRRTTPATHAHHVPPCLPACVRACACTRAHTQTLTNHSLPLVPLGWWVCAGQPGVQPAGWPGSAGSTQHRGGVCGGGLAACLRKQLACCRGGCGCDCCGSWSSRQRPRTAHTAWQRAACAPRMVCVRVCVCACVRRRHACARLLLPRAAGRARVAAVRNGAHVCHGAARVPQRRRARAHRPAAPAGAVPREAD